MAPFSKNRGNAKVPTPASKSSTNIPKFIPSDLNQNSYFAHSDPLMNLDDTTVTQVVSEAIPATPDTSAGSSTAVPPVMKNAVVYANGKEKYIDFDARPAIAKGQVTQLPGLDSRFVPIPGYPDIFFRTPSVAPNEEQAVVPRSPIDSDYDGPNTIWAGDHELGKRGLPSACVFVANLAAHRSDEQLQESVYKHFSKYAQKLHVKIRRDTKNMPYSFVQFESEQVAQFVIQHVRGSVIDDRYVRVEHARVNRTIIITHKGGLELDEVETRNQLATNFGPTEKVDFSTGGWLNKGGKKFGCMVKFVYRQDAIECFSNLRHHPTYQPEWCNNTMAGDFDTKHQHQAMFPARQVQIDHYSIFIGNLNGVLVNRESLISRFEQYGPVKECSYHRKKDAHGNFAGVGFGFIEFETTEAVQTAIRLANNAFYLGKNMHVQRREIHEKHPHYDHERARSILLNHHNRGFNNRGVAYQNGNHQKHSLLQYPAQRHQANTFPNFGNGACGNHAQPNLMLPAAQKSANTQAKNMDMGQFISLVAQVSLELMGQRGSGQDVVQVAQNAFQKHMNSAIYSSESSKNSDKKSSPVSSQESLVSRLAPQVAAQVTTNAPPSLCLNIPNTAQVAETILPSKLREENNRIAFVTRYQNGGVYPPSVFTPPTSVGSGFGNANDQSFFSTNNVFSNGNPGVFSNGYASTNDFVRRASDENKSIWSGHNNSLTTDNYYAGRDSMPDPPNKPVMNPVGTVLSNPVGSTYPPTKFAQSPYAFAPVSYAKPDEAANPYHNGQYDSIAAALLSEAAHTNVVNTKLPDRTTQSIRAATPGSNQEPPRAPRMTLQSGRSRFGFIFTD